MRTRKRYSRLSNFCVPVPEFSKPHLNRFQKIGWGLFFLYLFVIGVCILSPAFKLSKTDCSYFAGAACPPAVEAEIARSFGKLALTFSSFSLEQTLKSAVPEASEVQVKVILPDIVKVQFIEQPPLYQICHLSKTVCYAVDDNMQVTDFQNSPFHQLTTVITPDISSVNIGASLYGSQFAPLHQLVILLMQNGIEHQEIELHNAQLITVNLAGGRKALFTADMPITRQVTSLQLILTKVTMEKPLPIIDVRFEKPVLKPEP